jgi:parallel beta-helix repeat protein
MKRNVSWTMLALLLVGTFALAFYIRPAKAQAETVYISSNGSVVPSSAPISSLDNVTYAFTGDISYPAYYGIVIERSNVVIDGRGYTAQGNLSGTGLNLMGVGNVTIKNANIDGFGFGICLYSSNNNMISRNNVTANYYDGLWLNYSSGNTISRNSLTDNNYGIELEFSSGNTISGNNIRADHVGGILLGGSSGNSVSENNMTNNLYGIGLVSSSTSLFAKISYSSNNAIFGNNITANDVDGIWLIDSSGNTISGNNVAENNVHGIYFEASSNNKVYHNSFIGNKLQASVDTWSLGNAWNDTYPSGGNYWSDYNGTDSCRGLYQNETGSDGIGDTPYKIDANNTDHYPLMKSYPCIHAVAVEAVRPSKAVIGQDFTAGLSVNTANLGHFDETLKVTIYAKSSAAPKPSASWYYEITLAGESSSAATFVWNTTGSAYGNYTITVSVEPVPNETDTADNTCCGWIIVTIPGDVNGDFTVNISDAIIVGDAFLATPTSSNWNPNADINGDGIVNILDAIILTNNFLQHYS